ncbi:hypothetical protein MUP65_01620 [Patescibacteria group bacterium]|nr:hypothetical protein [Patescibacteria group bacterium]
MKNVACDLRRPKIGSCAIVYDEQGLPLVAGWSIPEGDTLHLRTYEPAGVLVGQGYSFGWHEELGLVAFNPTESGQGGLAVTTVQAGQNDQEPIEEQVFGQIEYSFNARIGAWESVGQAA